MKVSLILFSVAFLVAIAESSALPLASSDADVIQFSENLVDQNEKLRERRDTSSGEDSDEALYDFLEIWNQFAYYFAMGYAG